MLSNLIESYSDESTLSAVLEPTQPFNFKAALHSLKASGAADLNDSFGAEDESIERALIINERPILLRLAVHRHSGEMNLLDLTLKTDDQADAPPTKADLARAVDWSSRRFWLDLDLDAVRKALSVNEYGEELIARYWPVRPPNLADPWDGLLKTVISVQIYPGLAARLQQGLLDLYGLKAYFNGKAYCFFPTPSRLAEILPEELSAMRFSRQKAAYVSGIARALLAAPEKYNWDYLRSLSGEEAVSALDDLPGVGPWTAHYVAMRGLAHPDVFVDEAGLRKILATAFNHRAALSQEEASRLTAVYAPYRSFACYYTYMKMYSA